MANPEHVEIVKAGTGSIRQWRENNPRDALDLSRANLSFADLSRANLSRAGLRYANLGGANLSGADLSGADLRNANLIHACLSGVNFSGANLSDAHLSHARLSGVNFSGANLSGLHLSGSVFSGEHPLSAAKGLDAITHGGPSVIGHDLLFSDGANLPETFLRGCGVSDEVIAYLPAFSQAALEFYSGFISYSHKDKSFAQRLHNDLQAKGIRVWLDDHEILPGDDIYRSVDRGLRIYDKTLLCCSKSSLKSPWVEREVETAIETEMDLHRQHEKSILKLIPLDLDGYLFDGYDGPHAATLRSKRAVANFKGWDNDNQKYERQLEKVVQAMRSDSGARKPEPKPKLG